MCNEEENKKKKENSIEGGIIKKGGLNPQPSTDRPATPPEAQAPKPPKDQNQEQQE